MRIIAGDWRGRRLAAPVGGATRPTADRVRETLFSILASRLGSFQGLQVADLFAGSGALGLEVLSRGAERCVFVEQDRAALSALRTNVTSLHANAEIIARSVLDLGPANKAFDLLFLDPPYAAGLVPEALAVLARQGWLAERSLISVETARAAEIAALGFEILTARNVGAAQLALLRLRA